MTNRPQRTPVSTPRRPRSRSAVALLPALCASWSGVASAAPPGQNFETVHVLELSQQGELASARGLTAAIKQRVRDAPEHALSNTDLPFDALLGQCPHPPLVGADGSLREPPRRCLDVVGRSLSDRVTLPGAYLWGAVYRPPGARSELRVRLHLWRERIDDRVEQAVVPEGADGDALDALAERLVARLLYAGQAWLVRVATADRLEGEVYVDGKPRGALHALPRWFAVAPGEHVFELRVGSTPVARTSARVGLADGLEVRLEPLAPTPPAPAAPVATPPETARPPAAPPEARHNDWKRPAGFVGLGLGAALIGAGVLASLRVKGLDDDFRDDPALAAYRRGVTGADDSCDAAESGAPSLQAGAATAGRVDRLCTGLSTWRAAQYVFYGAGLLAAGAGAYLLATSPGQRPALAGSRRPPSPAATAPAWSFSPWLSPGTGGLRVGASFLPAEIDHAKAAGPEGKRSARRYARDDRARARRPLVRRRHEHMDVRRSGGERAPLRSVRGRGGRGGHRRGGRFADGRRERLGRCGGGRRGRRRRRG
jgi:hypothetical protein